MFSRKFLAISLMFLILLVSLGVVCADENVTGDITETADENLIEDIDVNEVQNKIDEAEEGGTIQLDGNYNSERLKINKSVTVRGSGEGAIINSTNYNLLEITSGDVTLDNLRFQNFYSFMANNTKLTIINCTFDNFTYSSRNSIDVDDLTVTDSKFINLREFLFTGKMTTFKNCYFRTILVDFNGDSINMVDCVFNRSDSTLPERIAVSGNSVSIINSTCLNMSFYCENGKCNFVNSKFMGKQILIWANNVEGCLFENIESFNLKFLNSDSNLMNSRFINCSGYEFRFIQSNQNINVKNCQFISNHLPDSACVFLTFGKSVVVSNNSFMDNFCQYLIYAVSTTPDFHAKSLSATKIDSKFNLNNNLFIGNYYNDGIHSRILLTPTLASYMHKDYFANELDLKNNFFGFNMDEDIELELLKPIFISNYWVGDDYWYHMAHWANVKLQNNSENSYHIEFVDVGGKTIEMPTTTFSIIDKTTKEVLASNITQKSIFKLNKTISLDNVYVINAAGEKVNKDPAKIEISIKGSDYGDLDIRFTLKNNTQPLAGENVYLSVYDESGKNHLQYIKVTTSNDGSALFYNQHMGWGAFRGGRDDVNYYTLKIIFSNDEFGLAKLVYNHLKVKKLVINAEMSSISTVYGVDKKASVTISNFKFTFPMVLRVDIYDGKKLIKTIYEYIENGKNTFKLPKLNAGTYKIVVWYNDEYYVINKVATALTVKKAPTTVNAPKLTAKAKKSAYFKVTVKHKTTKKAAEKVKIKLKIGKKTYKVKTDKNGVAKFNTKKLKVGKYSVVVSSANSNYQISAKSQITIKR